MKTNRPSDPIFFGGNSKRKFAAHFAVGCFTSPVPSAPASTELPFPGLESLCSLLFLSRAFALNFLLASEQKDDPPFINFFRFLEWNRHFKSNEATPLRRGAGAVKAFRPNLQLYVSAYHVPSAAALKDSGSNNVISLNCPRWAWNQCYKNI